MLLELFHCWFDGAQVGEVELEEGDFACGGGRVGFACFEGCGGFGGAAAGYVDCGVGGVEDFGKLQTAACAGGGVLEM